ncbi:MAG: hypothetical protein WEB60_08410 [Terrimicrobiaceae bacterium]
MTTTKKKAATTKSAAKKPAASKASAPKKATPSKATTAKSREEKAAEKTIELLDEAARILRSSLRAGAKTTAESRVEAKQKAHSLVTKASNSLSHVVDGAGSILHKAINKTLGGI